MGSHDNLVKHAFADVEHARGVLATALPPALAARVDFATLRLVRGSFVDEDLQESHSDLLYEARIGGRDGLIYCLWEHKSAPEPLTTLQTLRYLVRIWDQHLASLPKKKRGEVRKIPVIVPIVLHHGEEGWTAAETLEELYDADPDLLAALGEHVPRMRVVLDDLAEQTDEQIHARAASAFARLVLWALKHAREAGWLGGDIGVWRQLIAAVLAEHNGTRALTALFRYILRASPTAERQMLRKLLPEDRGTAIEEDVMNWFETEVHKGEQRGEQKASRRMLLKQLRMRFGELPEAVVARIEAADIAELDLWSERFVTATRLEDVLGPAAS